MCTTYRDYSTPKKVRVTHSSTRHISPESRADTPKPKRSGISNLVAELISHKKCTLSVL